MNGLTIVNESQQKAHKEANEDRSGLGIIPIRFVFIPAMIFSTGQYQKENNRYGSLLLQFFCGNGKIPSPPSGEANRSESSIFRMIESA
jgi:hypothetical protein